MASHRHGRSELPGASTPPGPTRRPPLPDAEARRDRRVLTSATVAGLQQSAGNRAVTRLLQVGQASLGVGPGDDPLEREADAMAHAVVAGGRSTRAAARLGETTVRAGGPGAPIRRRVDRIASGVEGGAVDGEVESMIRSARGSGASLPGPARSSMEEAFGADFSSVRLHAGPGAARLNRALSAEAFTVGSDIFLGDGMPDVASAAGRSLLAHELTHTIQQGATGVARSPRVQRRGRRGKLRAEADRAVTGSKLNVLKVTVAGSGDLVWKTNKNRIDEKGWEAVRARDGLKSHEKEDKVGGDGVVDRELSFAGPLALGGAKDAGSNSIKKLVRYVPDRVEAAVRDIGRRNDFPIRIVLRAHSRGAVAGSHIVNELAGRRLKDGSNGAVAIEVVLFEPVPGPGHAKKFEKIHLDPFIEQTTVVYSVKSGYAAFFDPARVLNAKRIIITGEPHSAGIQHGFTYNGVQYSGSDLSSLPEGVYVERSSQPGVLRKAEDLAAAKRRMQRTFASIERAGGSKARSTRIKQVLENYFNPTTTFAANPLYEG